MFKKKGQDEQLDTIIGSNAYFKGDIEVKGGVLIDGRVEGNVKTEGSLIIGKEGYIVGDVYAMNLNLNGKIEGKVYIKNRVEISSNGKIEGELHCKILVVDEGGYINGTMDMNYQE
jgi:cytoskeletal protein CcmA (bactofilin family)